MKETIFQVWEPWMVLALSNVAQFEKQLNAINVFPVPDGDTGSNMAHTLEGAIAENPMDGASQALSASRGNSGTLLAIWLKAMVDSLTNENVLSSRSIQQALILAAHEVEVSLSQPQSGTIITAMKSLAEVPVQSVLTEYVSELCTAALRSTEESQNILQEAQRAHTVDAGAAGFVLVIQALAHILQAPANSDEEIQRLFASEPTILDKSAVESSGVEVVCLVHLPILDVAELRLDLEAHGDSVVLAPLHNPDDRGDGEDSVPAWKIHVHAQSADEILGRIENFAEPLDIHISSLAGVKH